MVVVVRVRTYGTAPYEEGRGPPSHWGCMKNGDITATMPKPHVPLMA